jgi:hypothetical protein
LSDPDARLKILVAHASETREFAETLALLLAEVLRLGALSVRRCEVTSAPDSRTPEAVLELASQAPVLVVVDLCDTPEPAPGLDGLLAGAEGDALRIRISTRGVKSARPSPRHLEVAGWDLEALEDLIGRIAGELGNSETLALQRERGRLEALRRLAHGRQQAALGTRQRLERWGRLALVPVLVAAGYYAWFESDWRRGRFEFEQDTQGWTAESGEQRGCTRVGQSDDRARWGSGALELELDLDPQAPARRAGEARVELTKASLQDVTLPLDLRGKRVSLWVWAPAQAAGPEKHPNGFQLFVKDTNWAGHYGPWVNVKPEVWTELVLAVGEDADGSHPNESFAASAVAVIGVKLEVGGGSAEGFTGEVYVDSVDW